MMFTNYLCRQIFCVVRRSLAAVSKIGEFSKIRESRDFPKEALDAKHVSVSCRTWEDEPPNDLSAWETKEAESRLSRMPRWLYQAEWSSQPARLGFGLRSGPPSWLPKWSDTPDYVVCVRCQYKLQRKCSV